MTRERGQNQAKQSATSATHQTLSMAHQNDNIQRTSSTMFVCVDGRLDAQVLPQLMHSLPRSRLSGHFKLSGSAQVIVATFLPMTPFEQVDRVLNENESALREFHN